MFELLISYQQENNPGKRQYGIKQKQPQAMYSLKLMLKLIYMLFFHKLFQIVNFVVAWPSG
jgi:hypothetical protein